VRACLLACREPWLRKREEEGKRVFREFEGVVKGSGKKRDGRVLPLLRLYEEVSGGQEKQDMG